MLAAVRSLNRLELVGETLRAALNALAVAAPDWLRSIAPPDWHERYDRRVEDMRLAGTPSKREAYAAQVGTDGFALLDGLDHVDAPPGAAALPEVAVLRRVWARNFERDKPDADGSSAGDQTGEPAVVIGDLSALTAMRGVAAQANALRHFDAVIHNVGLGFREPGRAATEDGLSQLWAVNVLAPTC